MTSARAEDALHLPSVLVTGDREKAVDLDRKSDSASRLGLSVRETPASIEILDQSQLQRQGVRSVSEVADAAVGVLAGDFPAEPSAFAMRGLANSQINTLYNGIKIGPQNMTSRVMDTGNLDRIEILKGPASLMSGEGAVGGAINFVTKKPHSGPVENEAYVSYGSFKTIRTGFGSGGSTPLQGLVSGQSSVYLVHSFEVIPDSAAHRLAYYVYGGRVVCAAIASGRVFGCQFHPEKSGPVGLKVISAFTELV